jgi:Family of unknown function (DUF6158)
MSVRHESTWDGGVRPGLGVEPAALSDDDLLRELRSVHDTRHETFRHGSDDALANHDRRTAELEREYLVRFPHREVDPQRLPDRGA